MPRSAPPSAARESLSVAQRVVQGAIRRRLRGSTRLLRLLRTIPSERVAPIQISDWAPVYIDLKINDQNLFVGAPWARTPLEPHTARVVDTMVTCGQVAYDVGANYGLVAMHLAQRVGPTGRVEVFEPNPALQSMLERTLAAVPYATLHRVAVSNANGTVTLHVPEDHSMGSLARWHATHGQAGATAHPCRAVALDTYIDEAGLPAPDFLKVDVEGAERLVFEGARGLLDRADAPIVLFEENAAAARSLGHDQSAARRLLLGLSAPRYECFLVERPSGTLRPVSGDIPGWSDLLAVPARLRARVEPLFAD